MNTNLEQAYCFPHSFFSTAVFFKSQQAVFPAGNVLSFIFVIICGILLFWLQVQQLLSACLEKIDVSSAEGYDLFIMQLKDGFKNTSHETAANHKVAKVRKLFVFGFTFLVKNHWTILFIFLKSLCFSFVKFSKLFYNHLRAHIYVGTLLTHVWAVCTKAKSLHQMRGV